jgi:sugar/nucleoside kinase (ribokinase family)
MSFGGEQMQYAQLMSVLENPPTVQYPVILPDFFVDHFVILPTYEGFVKSLDELAGQGGGNLMDNEQFIRRGGNCVNTVSALHALDVNAKMILTTDEYGASLLEALAPPGLDRGHIHKDGRLSATVSIETEFQGRKINIMISDSGSASAFGLGDLTDDDIELACQSGLVAIVNLNHNNKGAELASGLFKIVKENSNAITFMDMGDPSGKPDLVVPLVKNVINEGLVDVLGANENEVGWFAWAITGKDERWRYLHSNPKEWILGAKKVSDETGVSIDLHTPHFSAVITQNEVVSAPTFQIKSRVVCGAGDAWNAGDIYGLLLALSPKNRIILANAIAALYVSSPDASHPSRREILTYLASNPQLSINGKKLLMQNYQTK